MSFQGAGGRKQIIRKRPVLAKEGLVEAIVITKHTDLDSILTDAKSILAKSLDNLRTKVDAGYSLNSDEIKDFKQLTSILKDVGTETRANEIHSGAVEHLDNMSTEQLLELSKQLLDNKSSSSSDE